MANRLTAVAVTFALFGAGVSPCAGWLPTEQARQDCCVEDQCPAQVDADSQPAMDMGHMPQTAADQCCATSEQQHQQHSAQIATASFVVLPPVERATVTVAEITPPDRANPDAAPNVHRPARLHLLFSVYLV